MKKLAYTLLFLVKFSALVLLAIVLFSIIRAASKAAEEYDLKTKTFQK